MKQRLALLLQADVISQRSYVGSLEVLALLNQMLDLKDDNEQYQMAITHLARAADRIWQHEPIREGMDPEILEEIYTDPAWEKVNTLHLQVVGAMGLGCIPEEEESYLLANIYSLYQLDCAVVDEGVVND
ncbi:hypothetical protein [Thaumasiovibrio sp. DFM-14]|uniref:hypothetical protein n=1 Tax=Thaumasiovibrio sp. DFM-14 TaxID=3384792 RepID=UPI0039A28213